jgi:Ca2+-binding EF-hand superfamily protein
MDPWEAVSTASPDVLVDILREAYSLFDIDNSGTMDSIEFEQVLAPNLHK